MSLQDRLILAHLKRTHGTLNESVDQTETPEFKKWFGNSKVVDAQGKPLRLYHGTDKHFFKFHNKRRGFAFYFTPDPIQASSYATEREGASVMPVYLSVQNLYEGGRIDELMEALKIGDDYYPYQRSFVQKKLEILDPLPFHIPSIIKKLKKLGYDGFIEIENGIKQIGAFKSTQIKSATGNNGNFNANNPNINESVNYEEIQAGKLYKIDENTRISFEPVMENVWTFSLINTEGAKEIGRVYKVSENDYVSRSVTAPDLENYGKNMVDSALELCAMLGEI